MAIFSFPYCTEENPCSSCAPEKQKKTAYQTLQAAQPTYMELTRRNSVLQMTVDSMRRQVMEIAKQRDEALSRMSKMEGENTALRKTVTQYADRIYAPQTVVQNQDGMQKQIERQKYTIKILEEENEELARGFRQARAEIAVLKTRR